MSCTKANVTLVFSDIKASVSACRQAIASILPENTDVFADADIEKAIRLAEAKVVNSGLCVGVSKVEPGISAVIKIICTSSAPDTTEYYLEIEPELIWVYPDWSVENRVYSNTNWIIE